MSDDRSPLSGPNPIYVVPLPGGVALDLSAYVTSLITELAADDELFEAFMEIADRDETRLYDGHRPEELLVEQLVARLRPQLPVYGRECVALADRIRAAAASLPGQRGAA